MNVFYLLAALADLTAVLVHGVIGHRIFLAPMTNEGLFATREFGDADMSRRVFVVTWHVVTATFGSSAVMMTLLAFDAVRSTAVPVFLSAMHGSFLLIGVGVAGGRIGDLLRPIPAGFVACMSTAALMGLLGTS